MGLLLVYKLCVAKASRVSRDNWIMVRKNIEKEIKLEKFRTFVSVVGIITMFF